MQLMIARLLKNTLFSSSLTLITGTVLAQLVPVFLQVYLRRVFGEEVFAAYALYISLVGVIVIMSTLRYEMAIVLPRKDHDAANIFVLSILLSALINLIFFTIIIVMKEEVAVLIDFPQEYSIWLYFVPLSAFLASSYRTINFWLIRKKAFKASSLNKVFRRSGEGMVQGIGAGLKFPKALVFGDISGNILNILIGGYQMLKKQFTFQYIKVSRIKINAKRYSEFPGFNLFPALLNTVSLLLPVFFVSRFFSDANVANFDLTRQVLLIPSAFISISISQVLLQQLSAKRNSGKSILGDLRNVFIALSTLAILEVIILFFFGPDLFSLIFGEKWNDAGVYAQILVFGFALKFMVSPLSSVFIALEKLKLNAVWQLLYFSMIFSLWFFRSWEAQEFLRMYMYVDLIAYGVYLLMIVYLTINYEKKTIQNGKI
ncbi:MAG: hypothetical protein C0594_02945 [Marinilabiliales bacterium]|nr:MAG: hypothetical protein C0594_02945 [Marinilabiliales bacterium]